MTLGLEKTLASSEAPERVKRLAERLHLAFDNEEKWAIIGEEMERFRGDILLYLLEAWDNAEAEVRDDVLRKEVTIAQWKKACGVVRGVR